MGETTKKVTPEQLGDAVSEATLQIMHETADRAFSLSQQNLIENKWDIQGKNGIITTTITDTGELLNSGRIIHTKNGARIIYSSEHAEDVEYGVPPGRQPDQLAIERWARRKLNMPLKEAKSASYAISKDIFQHGTDARPFMRSAILMASTSMQGASIGQEIA